MPTSVRVLIPTKAAHPELLCACVESVLERTTGVDVRVTVLDTSEDGAARGVLGELAEQVQIDRVEHTGPFRFGPVMNDAVRAHDEQAVLLLNDDTRVPDTPVLLGVAPERWLAAMLGELAKPSVAVVGAVLLHPDGTLQHAGIIHGVPDGLLSHAGRGLPVDSEHASRFLRTREVTAVTGACMLLDREAFLGAGGFDAAEMAEAYHDPDLCHRLRDNGLSTRLAGEAVLFHHEGVTRGTDDDPRCHAAYKRAHDHRVERFGDAAEVLLGGPASPGAGKLVFRDQTEPPAVHAPDPTGGTAFERLRPIVEDLAIADLSVPIQIGLDAATQAHARAKRQRVIWVLPEPEPRGDRVDGRVRTLDVGATDRAALLLVASEHARRALRSCGVRCPVAVLRPPIGGVGIEEYQPVLTHAGDARLLIPTGEPPVPCPRGAVWDATAFGSDDWPRACAQPVGVVLHPFVEPDAGLVLDLLERRIPIVAPRVGVCEEVLRAVPGIELLSIKDGFDQGQWERALSRVIDVEPNFEPVRALAPSVQETIGALHRWVRAVARS